MELDVKLLNWQQKVMASDARFKVVAAGRRCGKSRLAAWTMIIRALQAPKCTVFYVAPTQGQARDIMWGLPSILIQLDNTVVGRLGGRIDSD